MKNKVMLGYIAIYFIILYLVAFISNLRDRQDDDVLFISRNQWKAILVMWIPSLVLVISEVEI